MQSTRTAVFERITQVREWSDSQRLAGHTIALVPTMGALHRGHISLVEHAKKRADRVISSIFVNPTQFNNATDLLKYPRSLDKDIEMLSRVGCDIVFAPDVAEIYPDMRKGHWDFGLFTSRLEGYYRPGHFDGVCTVVKKLFEIVTPHVALFGEKDFQQLAIIRKLVEFEKMDIEIIGCPTLREPDGLAMSSRNLRLTEPQRQSARKISESLFAMQEHKHKFSPEQLEQFGKDLLRRAKGLRTEYLEIVDGDTFEDIVDWNVKRPVALFAGYYGEVRLIDNVLL